MKAAVFHKPGDISYDTVDDPRIEDGRDVILKVTATAIYGSDLHILDGGIPQSDDMIVGHEFMGIVEEVGSEIKNLKVGDRWSCPSRSPAGIAFSVPMVPRPTVRIPITSITAPRARCLI